MFEFRLPDLGEGIHEGEILQWFVAVGDAIAEDAPLVEVETDKAAVTIPSPRGGSVHSLTGGVGDTVYTGQVIAVIDDGSATQEKPRQSEAATATSTAPSNASSPDIQPTPSASNPAAPATRRLARELGVDINAVRGSGPAGRVTAEDVHAAATGKATAPAQPSGDTPPEEVAATTQASISSAEVASSAPLPSQHAIPLLDIAPLPDFSTQGAVTVEPLRSIRRKIARKMTSAALLVPHAAHLDEADVTDLYTFAKHNSQDGLKLRLLPFVMKAMAALLRDYPGFNASLDSVREQLIYKRYYNIGFAADTPKGLMVPVIKAVTQKSIMDLSREVEALAHKAREGTIEPDELSGGTFTITNIGALGGTGMQPIINYPESAILGMGFAAEKPVVQQGRIVIRRMLPLNLTFDHRLVDGADAARLLGKLKTLLANPQHLLLSV